LSKKEFKLQQTKGQFKLVGQVVGLTRENAYREGIIENGQNEGKQYRSIRFGVKTSPTNQINVELFGMERDFIYPYNTKEKKSIQIPFNERDNLPPSYHIIGVNCSLKKDEKGKLVRESLVEYDAVKYIYDHLNDGDSVYISGELQFGTYENQKGETVNQTRYVIKTINLQNQPVNFEDEQFAEVASFEQEIVVTDTTLDKETKKVFVNAYVIGYGDKFEPAQFVVDGNTLPKLATNVAKKFKFGDFVKVAGKCLNCVELVETNDQLEDEWGGEKPKGFNSAIKNYTTELRITYVDPDTYEPKKYKESDFVKDEPAVTFEEDDDLDKLFGNTEKNPFDDSSDDSLPFDLD
jgi:hypothetical protein